MAPNLLLVIVDALRADRVGFAGLARAETPFLDSLAARGTRFTRCFTASPWTLPACASIVTGLLPSQHGLIHHDRRFGAPKIPAFLPGYATFGVGNNGNLVPDDIPQAALDALEFERRPEMWKRFGWQEGFETYRWFHKEHKDGPFAAFAEWLAARPRDPRPWFAMLHTNLVHDYDFDHPWAVNCERFLGRPLNPALRKFRDGPHVWREPPEGMSQATLAEELLAKYDACVAECDRRLAAALASVDFARTVVVIVSDHGEGFDGERCRVHHCGRMHSDLLHVPLVVVLPSEAEGSRSRDTRMIQIPCSTIDIAPTLLAIAGVDASRLPGSDLRALPASRRLSAEDFGYLYLPPNDVAERLRRFEYRTHEVESRAEILWPAKRVTARLGRQTWAERYDLELDPEERINSATGVQAPTRRPERDEGALRAKLRDLAAESEEMRLLDFGDHWPSFVRRVSAHRRLPHVARTRRRVENFEPFTFIVAVDDPVELRRHVIASPCFQRGGHQWLFVENRGNRAYSSISRLYVEVTRKAEFDLRCYVHQDVFFPPDWEARVADVLHELGSADPNWGVVGVAGRAPHTDSGDASLVGHWSDPHKYHEPKTPLPAEAQILDELLLVVRRGSGLSFDPDLPGFHCYGADICLAARDRGMKNYVVDAPVVHKLFRPDGTLIESAADSPKVAARRTDSFRADFERSAEYVRRKWAKFLPFQSPSHRFR